VLQRIKDLDTAGNYSATPRVKWPEPERKKTHWDFFLEEVVWLATDFRQERKWKMALAKKTATLVMKWHAQRVASSQRNMKIEQVKVRKVASLMAREVKKFWAQLEKVLVEEIMHRFFTHVTLRAGCVASFTAQG
jgi:hypothetical protein